MKQKKFTDALGLTILLALVGCGKVDNSNSNSSLPSDVDSNSAYESNSNDKASYETISIAQAIAIANATGTTETTEKYYVAGKITSITNSTFGELTITDGTNSLYIYGVYGKDENLFADLPEKPSAGDEIVVYGSLKMYKDLPEMGKSTLIAWTKIDVSDKVDLTQYAEKTILQAREVADDVKVKVSGVVAAITYSNGMNPNGFYLTDNEASIYVYGGDAAQQVKVGNTITVAAQKDFYVLDSEIQYAKKFGYQGSNQLALPYIIENDKATSNVDLSWVNETTIKDILETPLTNNITTNIYKVNAVIHKSLGEGFVNYYLDDLDDKTGTYTYTQNNGNDFSWLDTYDGKICTVYLSPINCKSTATGCVYRFLPIQVMEEDFQFDESKAPRFALDYFATSQFLQSYNADPELEVVTSVTSSLLNIENVVLTYTSSNTNSVYFETIDSKTIMHTKNAGTAVVTIHASYKNYSDQMTVTITINESISMKSLTVKEAIKTEDGTEVIVKGIVSSSTVNQKSGLYLIDETGSITVRLTSADDLTLLKLGNEVIIKGTRSHITKDAENIIGQSCIDSATVLQNNYGSYEYSTASFIETTFMDVFNKIEVATVDYTTQVFVIDAYIKQNQYNYSINASVDSAEYITLYASGNSQYAFLQPYANQTVKMEVALCNWNTKSVYKACVLSIITEDGKVLNTAHISQ